VHPITENSPLYNLTEDDYKKTQGEILIYLKAFDDMFANTVTIRKSYTFQEIIAGAKFVPMFQRSATNTKTILHLDKIGATVPADLNEKMTAD
jgi:inward rectifier potassium channel